MTSRVSWMRARSWEFGVTAIIIECLMPVCFFVVVTNHASHNTLWPSSGIEWLDRKYPFCKMTALSKCERISFPPRFTLKARYVFCRRQHNFTVARRVRYRPSGVGTRLR